MFVDSRCLEDWRDEGLGISDVLDGTLYVGERDNGVFYKVYRKIKDQVVSAENDQWKVVPEEEQVVRTEVTFTGTSVIDFLGGNKLSDLTPISLAKGRSYLQFGVPVIRDESTESSPLLKNLIRKSADITLYRLERAGVMCLAQHQIPMDGRRRTKRGPVAIHEKFSVITRNAQRRLTHQFFTS